MNEKRRPCPFCGSENIELSGCRKFWMECLQCGGEGPIHNSQQEAIDAWNGKAKDKK